MQETHAEMVTDLAKSGDEILETLTPDRVHAMHMAAGIAGEAGEVLDEIKKSVMYDKDFNIEKIIIELGDIEFYLEGLRQGFGISRQVVLDRNIEKLRKRYGEKYSDQAAHNRVDQA